MKECKAVICIKKENEKKTIFQGNKVNMFALLGKPGFEEVKAELEKRLK